MDIGIVDTSARHGWFWRGLVARRNHCAKGMFEDTM